MWSAERFWPPRPLAPPAGRASASGPTVRRAEVTDGWKVDRAERGIRFGCGVGAGLIFGFFIAIREAAGDVGVAVAVAIGSALVLGLLAAVYGDRFWERLSKVLWWFR